MKTIYRATIGRITYRFDWDTSGVLLATLLLIGETVAVVLAAKSLASDGFNFAALAALVSASSLDDLTSPSPFAWANCHSRSQPNMRNAENTPRLL